MDQEPVSLIRQPAEERHRQELAALQAVDRYSRPENWLLSPRMVETFILGSREPLTTPDGREVTQVPGGAPPGSGDHRHLGQRSGPVAGG